MGKIKPKVSMNSRKKKYRRQDPEYRGPREAVIPGRNRAPINDEDIIDIPRVVAAFTPVFAEPEGHGPAELPKTEREKNRHKKRKADRKAGLVPPAPMKKDAEKPEGAAAANAPKLPKQRPGESPRAYAARVDEAVKQRLLEQQRKVSTPNARQKKRRRAEEKKSAALEKVKAKRKESAGDGLFNRAEKATFGDVVLRPPILSQDARKSRSKLQGQHATKGLAGGSGISDFADYAAKVKAAYSDLRSKRLKAAGATLVGGS